MKHFIISFILILLLTACSQDYEKAQSWNTISENGEGNITLKYVASDGFAYYLDNGQLTGVTTEIFRDFVEWVQNEYEVSLTVHFEPYVSWREFYNSVQNSPDGTFGMGNVTITEARWEELDFSPPYMTNIAAMVTHSDVPELDNLQNISTAFEGLSALAFEGTLHEERLRAISDNYWPDLPFSFATSNNEIMERVTASNSYFAYIDVYNYWRAAENGLPVRQHEAGSEPSEQFGYILPNNSDWEPVIRAFFEADGGYLNSDSYRQIMVSHLGEGLADLLENARQ